MRRAWPKRLRRSTARLRWKACKRSVSSLRMNRAREWLDARGWASVAAREPRGLRAVRHKPRGSRAATDAHPRASSHSRARFILKLETDLLQAFHRSLAVLLLNLFGQARRIGDGVNLLVGFRHDHDQQATQFVGDVAEAAVLAARH